MAKKSANPADAHRKALRAKELKKNKEGRKKIRETQTVKKDTRDLENEIRSMQAQGNGKPLNAEAKSRLADLEKELAYINKTKEEFVAAHPEMKDKVFKTHHRPREDREDKEDDNSKFDSSGRLKDPTRSIYFDPVYNPFGVPPPGMPYKERSPEPVPSEESSDDEDDDEIEMPDGPPPDSDEDSNADSDDIPLPEGTPPPTHQPPPPPLPPSGPSLYGAPIHLTGQYPTPFPIPFGRHPPPPVSPGLGGPGGPGFSNPDVPYDPAAHFPAFGPAPTPNQFRPPRPRQNQQFRPPASVQDPLSDAPTQTYQGYRMAKHDLPAKPNSDGVAADQPPVVSAPSVKTSEAQAGEISAAPVMRDLRKEATAFVPRGVKKRKPGGFSVNAAPGSGEVDADGDKVRVKQVEEGGGLLGKLAGVLGPQQPSTSNGGDDDEYQKFLDGLGDLA